jgi:hypothetical protein
MIRTSVLLFILSIGFLGCATYYIPLDSFESQFAGIDSSRMRTVELEGPLGPMYTYKANPIDTIRCVDSNNMPHKLVNGPAIEIRFTEKSGKRVVFFFDTVCINDSMIVGSESRLIPSIRDAISVNDVKLIEVQNGGKDFHYGKK